MEDEGKDEMAAVAGQREKADRAGRASLEKDLRLDMVKIGDVELFDGWLASRSQIRTIVSKTHHLHGCYGNLPDLHHGNLLVAHYLHGTLLLPYRDHESLSSR